MYLHVIERQTPQHGEKYYHDFYKMEESGELTKEKPWHLFSPTSHHSIYDGPRYEEMDQFNDYRDDVDYDRNLYERHTHTSYDII